MTIWGGVVFLGFTIGACALAAQPQVQEISIDANAVGRAFPHFWEQTFGSGRAHFSVARVDESHGNPMTLYKSMGSPMYPTMKQVTDLNHASQLPAPEEYRLKDGRLDLSLPMNGLALIEIINWN